VRRERKEKAMPYFKDSEECDEILGGFFRRMVEEVKKGNEEAVGIQKELGEIGLIVKFIWRDPELKLTLDFSKDPFGVHVNDETITPTASFTLTADNAHRFWHGQINLAKALTDKTIVARGPIPKILKLLPVIEPLYVRYPEYLEERGRADLVLKE
jgi:hypothetical protein